MEILLLGTVQSRGVCSRSQLSMSNRVEQRDAWESLHSPDCGNGQPGSCKYWILDLGTNGRGKLAGGQGRLVCVCVSLYDRSRCPSCVVLHDEGKTREGETLKVLGTLQEPQLPRRQNKQKSREVGWGVGKLVRASSESSVLSGSLYVVK